MTGNDYNMALFVFFIPVSCLPQRQHMLAATDSVYDAVYPLRGPIEYYHQEDIPISLAWIYHGSMGHLYGWHGACQERGGTHRLPSSAGIL